MPNPNGQVMTGRAARSDRTHQHERPVVFSKVPEVTGRVPSCPTGLTQRPVTHYLLCALPRQWDRTHPSSVRSKTDASVFTASTDRTQDPAFGHYLTSVWSLCETLSSLYRAPVKFRTLAQMYQPPSVSPCAHVLAYFHKHFQGC